MTKLLIPVEIEKSELLVDSRLIAQEMGVDHGKWISNIVQKYQKEIEENFGVFTFKKGKPTKKGGRPEKYCMLTENQAYYILTLSRNSKKVVQLKAKLVKSFSQCRKQIQAMQIEIMKNQSEPQWSVNRKQLKDSNYKLREAIKRYVNRHPELSDNKKKYVYSNVNDKLAIAIVGCRPAKFRRDNKTNTFREALNKNQLRDLELLESVVIRLIDNDIYPLDAIANAKERLMITM